MVTVRLPICKGQRRGSLSGSGQDESILRHLQRSLVGSLGTGTRHIEWVCQPAASALLYTP